MTYTNDPKSALLDPIARVSVLSTGSVAIRPEHVGPTWKPQMLWLLTSRRWTAPKPINVYVIEHRDGLVLFDAGQDRASVTDPDYFPHGLTGLGYSRLAKFDIAPDQTLTAGLRSLGYGIGDVHSTVISHLHQDHIGGLGELRSSKILVSNPEWASMNEAKPEMRGYLTSHIDLPGLSWQQIEPEPLADPTIAPFTHGHDVFGDGSLVVLPTPGHTPGSQSMLVRRPGRAPLLLVGDLTYDTDLLTAGLIPGVGEKKQLRSATAMVNALRATYPDLVILAAHDPHAASCLHQALGNGGTHPNG
jgi:glyoxylase-like metal-dependent hydrolase (beta-lactamase superfamily II)